MQLNGNKNYREFMNNKILIAEKVSKSFTNLKGEKITVLRDVSFSLEEHTLSTIVGASGAGKSTLLHILSGLDNLDSGSVQIDNTNLFALNDADISKFRNEKIGFVFQFHHLLPEFTALENVALPLLIKGAALKESLAEAEALLKKMEINHRKDHKPAELSGGEQQRIAVARALINKPLLIFADEPTGNLDSHNSELLKNLFIELNKEFNQTFLIVTHNKEFAQIGEHALEMKDGKLVNLSNSNFN